MRKLATIARIDKIEPIPNRDRIELAHVRGWTVIVPKDGFVAGERCVYFEPDSWLPADDARYSVIEKYSAIREDPQDGFRGYVLKSVKMAGVYSHGLVLPLSAFPELVGLEEGTDVTDLLRVRKYEPPVPTQLAGVQRGNFPLWIPKTDEERVQNVGFLLNHPDRAAWYASEKIDGSSMTVYVDETGYEGVCSRNWDLREDDKNAFWRCARRLELHRLIRDIYPRVQRVAFQGELFGEGVQGNPLHQRGLHFRLFTVVIEGDVLPRGLWPSELESWAVPIYEDMVLPSDVPSALQQVEGLKSLIAPERMSEGVVWRHRYLVSDWIGDQRVRLSFKAINQAYQVSGGG